MTFTLDTSGRVAGDLDGLAVWYEFEDLDPFTQGYVEALFRDLDLRDRMTWAIRASCMADLEPRQWRLDMLAPETLQRILTDCTRYIDTFPPRTRPLARTSARYGRTLWPARNTGQVEGFPPLTPYLGEDGKVYLREDANQIRLRGE